MKEIEITKQFAFDAGHRLSKGYIGQCSHLHGHRYTVEVTLTRRPQGDDTLNQYGMVYDFNDLDWFKQYLDETFDHKMLLWERDPFAHTIDPKYREELGIVLLKQNPTAEYIGTLLMAKLINTFYGQSGRVRPTKVTVWETPKCSATVYANNYPNIDWAKVTVLS